MGERDLFSSPFETGRTPDDLSDTSRNMDVLTRLLGLMEQRGQERGALGDLRNLWLGEGMMPTWLRTHFRDSYDNAKWAERFRQSENWRTSPEGQRVLAERDRSLADWNEEEATISMLDKLRARRPQPHIYPQDDPNEKIRREMGTGRVLMKDFSK